MEEPGISTQDEPTHSRPALTSTTSVQLINDSVDEEDEVCFFLSKPRFLQLAIPPFALQLVQEVRRAFLSQIKGSSNISFTNPGSFTSRENYEAHFNRIYEMLAHQNHRLTELYDQVCFPIALRQFLVFHILLLVLLLLLHSRFEIDNDRSCFLAVPSFHWKNFFFHSWCIDVNLQITTHVHFKCNFILRHLSPWSTTLLVSTEIP